GLSWRRFDLLAIHLKDDAGSLRVLGVECAARNDAGLATCLDALGVSAATAGLGRALGAAGIRGRRGAHRLWLRPARLWFRQALRLLGIDAHGDSWRRENSSGK